jgi:hypothetical protein
MELAVSEFRKLLTDTNELHGWRIPEYVTEYESRILAERLEQPNWRPEPSYAERFMQIRTREQALNLANVCFFTRTVFPELLERKGIQDSYYVQIGQSCYDRVLRDHDSQTLRIMRDHFEFLAEAAYTAIRHYGKFRSMWE